MNNIKKCSLSGIAFTFEEDAYDHLSTYLQELRNQYQSDPDGEEIIADIEARIAELILSTQDNGRTVGLPLVKNIIAQMGSAAEIEQESNPTLEGEGSAKRERVSAPRIPRRLYRDAEHGKLGGVCAGLGNYFDIDPVWVRLLIFLPLAVNILAGSWLPYWIPAVTANCFGVFVLCYLVLWFSIPAARTARQKLEMRGEKITAQSIRDKALSEENDIDGRSRAVVVVTVSTFGQFVQLLLKLLTGVILLGVVLVAGALLIGLLALIFDPVSGFSTAEHWVAVLGVLALLMPALLIAYVLLCLLSSRRPNGKGVGITFGVWVLVVLALLTLVVKSDLHRAFWYKSLPTPTYNSLNLLNDPAAEQAMEAFDEAMEAHDKAMEAHEEAIKNHKQAIKRHEKAVQQALVQGTANEDGGHLHIATPEAEVQLEANERGVRIHIAEKQSE